MAKKKKDSGLTTPTKISLAIIGAILAGLLGGWIGAGMRGGGSGGAASGSNLTDSSTGAWLDGIKKRGELRVGVAIAPPMTVERDGVLGGANLIPLQNLAKQMGVKLTPVPAQWSNIVAGLQANRYDVAANLDSTVERSLSIQFSDAVYEYQGVFVVKADSPWNSSTQIINSKKMVATAQGSAPGNACAAAGAKMLNVADYTNALQAVNAGRAIAVFTDLPTAESQVNADPSSLKIVVPDPPIYAASAGYGLPNTVDPRSMQTINTAIRSANLSGELARAYKQEKYVTIDNLGSMQKQA